MLAVVALIAAVAYLLTPLGASGPEGVPIGFRLNIRYLAPGLVLALALLAIPPPFAGEQRVWRLGTRRSLWRMGTLAIFAMLVVVSAGRSARSTPAGSRAARPLALTLVGASAALVLLSRAGPRARAARRVGLAALIALAIFGRIAQRRLPGRALLLRRPATIRPPSSPRSSWARASAPPTTGPAAPATCGSRSPARGRPLPVRPLGRGLEQPRSATSASTAPAARSTRSPSARSGSRALNDGDYDYVVTTPAYHQDDPAADTAPVQRDWIARAGNVQRVAGAGLVDVWKVTGAARPRWPARRVRQPASRPPRPGRGLSSSSLACAAVLPSGGWRYPLDNALFQWEEGTRRLRELRPTREPRARRTRAVDAIRDELRRRIGPTFSAAGARRALRRGTDWCLEAARRAAPMEAVDLDPQAITDGAFYLYLRGAQRLLGRRGSSPSSEPSSPAQSSTRSSTIRSGSIVTLSALRPAQCSV